MKKLWTDTKSFGHFAKWNNIDNIGTIAQWNMIKWSTRIVKDEMEN